MCYAIYHLIYLSNSDAMIGRKLRNRYTINEHLGDGSTATVYKGFDERLGRDVALKLLFPHVKDTTRKRFLQEATSAAALNHPNITAIYDIDDDGDQPFLVMEYVDGISLSDYIPAPLETIVELGTQIARALAYAHERQIIHRDIKPANIKVTSGGTVKIMDLGLALPSDAKRVTTQGMVIGTPAYLSPEQAQGISLDHRTDIYSLGIVLYEMATGKLPFDTNDISVLLLQQVKQAPQAPRLIQPTVTAALENVILKCMEKAPNRRYQSCSALASALLACLPNAPAQQEDWDNTPTLLSKQVPASAQLQTRTIRVILADDHTLLRRSLANLLETHDDFVIVAEAGDGEIALQQTLDIRPDVLLLDINMPVRNGLDVLPEIRQQAPNVKVLILTGREEDAYIIRALRAGANGYLLKSTDENELIEGLRKVVDGQLVLGRGVAEKMVTGMLSSDIPDPNRLSELDQKVLLHIAAGYDNETIARLLKVSLSELIETIASILGKLAAKDRHSAALTALRKGYILLDDLHDIGRTS
jgi:serine/threonine protein kinase/DNA-binding CsgD family transcriptional regulator